MRIFAFHLLNDFSGSPKVLMQVVKAFSNQGHNVTLIINKNSDGFLSNISNVDYIYFPYTFYGNRIARLLSLIHSQLKLFITLFQIIKKSDLLYINTVLPFGAAILGKIKKTRIVYHLHETTMKPLILKKSLFGIARMAASDVIYVSNYLSKQEQFSTSKSHILFNAIEDSFISLAEVNRTYNRYPTNVLMVCSLKKYKGVDEFVTLATSNPKYFFSLVVNASEGDIANYFKKISTPKNLSIHPTQKNLHPFYKWADVILNLSRPDGWIETFGLTIIEGMAYGLPAIVPTVGGVTELVKNRENGFLVDSRNHSLLHKRLNEILGNPNSYDRMVQDCHAKIRKYTEQEFQEQCSKILSR